MILEDQHKAYKCKVFGNTISDLFDIRWFDFNSMSVDPIIGTLRFLYKKSVLLKISQIKLCILYKKMGREMGDHTI